MHEVYELQKRRLWSISSTFYARFFCRYPFAKKSQSRTVIIEKLQNLLLSEKRVHKMLMKLAPVCKISRGVKIDSVLIILFIFTKKVILRRNFAFSLPKCSKILQTFLLPCSVNTEVSPDE